MSHPDLAFADHDHRRCRAALLAELRRAAERHGLRLTPMRVRVLELLAESHRAMGAYELLDRLAAEGRRVQPPAVYRALDFLAAAGFVHRIERLNAYVACGQPGAEGLEHGASFLICTDCRRVAELDDGAISVTVAQTAARRGFAVRRSVIEIEGRCPRCREATR